MEVQIILTVTMSWSWCFTYIPSTCHAVSGSERSLYTYKYSTDSTTMYSGVTISRYSVKQPVFLSIMFNVG